MYNYDSNLTLTNCTITNNSSAYNGGGMNNYQGSSTLTDTTVCSNTPDQINGFWIDNGGNCISEICDSDDDGTFDCFDICPGHDDNVDTDGDSIPDGCDICPGHDDNVETDGDSIPDGCDI